MKKYKWVQAVKDRDGWACRECGATVDDVGTRNIHAHHIKPYALGGEFTLDNGITLCKKHHRATHKREGRTPWGIYHEGQEGRGDD